VRHFIPVLLLSLASFSASAADNDAELKQLYDALNMLNQQQQAIYQQFLMVREMRDVAATRMLYGAPMGPQMFGQAQNFEEVRAAQQKAFQHYEALNQRADQLLARHAEIESQKEPLSLRIYELSLRPAEE
jgi:ABC-type phosphate transport system auxiliary subunit